jgi:cytochrome c-type biogenesis protein CcmH/NrfG
MESTAGPSLRAKHFYLLAVAAILAVLVIGYLPSGTQLPDSPAQSSAVAGSSGLPDSKMSDVHLLTPEELKQIAEQQAAPLIGRLQSDPNNSVLLAQVAAIYHVARQYSQAAGYYDRAVRLDPGSAALRTKLASSLFRSGDADGAIAELNRALKGDPHHANALFDLGVIRLEGKRDRKGALAAWKRLLESNPELGTERKSTVEKLIAEASATPADRHGFGGTRGGDAHNRFPAQ